VDLVTLALVVRPNFEICRDLGPFLVNMKFATVSRFEIALDHIQLPPTMAEGQSDGLLYAKAVISIS
jgi:hypothetical protein